MTRVYIASPDRFHAEHTITALAMGSTCSSRSTDAKAFVGAPILLATSDATLQFGGVIPAIDTVRESLLLVPIASKRYTGLETRWVRA